MTAQTGDAILDDVPELVQLLDSGIVWIESLDQVAGRASDGAIVSLGVVARRCDRLNLRSYLIEHPTPDTW